MALLRRNSVHHMTTIPMIILHIKAFQRDTEASTGQAKHPPERILSSF